MTIALNLHFYDYYELLSKYLKLFEKSPRVKEAPKAITYYEYSKQTAIIINSQVLLLCCQQQTRIFTVI